MSLYLSASTATQEQNVANSNDFTVHALRRDKDGMLHYTNARSTEDVVYDFHRTDGEEYKDFLQGSEYVDATPNVARQYSNDTDDKYQQFRFDFRRLTYFIDDDGYLVARLNKSYDHNTQGPK
tara:strand:- start:7420 stop:7788 length:369 start_codon:yes stop_codon:yes gene_type:complete